MNNIKNDYLGINRFNMFHLGQRAKIQQRHCFQSPFETQTKTSTITRQKTYRITRKQKKRKNS